MVQLRYVLQQSICILKQEIYKVKRTDTSCKINNLCEKTTTQKVVVFWWFIFFDKYCKIQKIILLQKVVICVIIEI